MSVSHSIPFEAPLQSESSQYIICLIVTILPEESQLQKYRAMFALSTPQHSAWHSLFTRLGKTYK